MAASGKLKLVTLPCEASQCTAADPGFEPLARQAKQAGARFVVIGAVEKTSTLIGWVKYSVLNVDDQRAICGELITYRGDTDESWRRAAKIFGGTDRQTLSIRRMIHRPSLSVVHEFRSGRRVGVCLFLAKLRNLQLGRSRKV